MIAEMPKIENGLNTPRFPVLKIFLLILIFPVNRSP
jgi:hypothetical protein